MKLENAGEKESLQTLFLRRFDSAYFSAEPVASFSAEPVAFSDSACYNEILIKSSVMFYKRNTRSG